MAAGTEPGASSAGREIVIIRTLSAPPRLVWRAWTDPKQIVQWWGPNGFTTTTNGMEVRPGGVWDFEMHGPDGRNYPNRINFEEVVEPERLVYSHRGEADVEPVRFRTTVTFEKQDDKTRLTLRMVFPSTIERDRIIREYGAVQGGIQTVGRLAAHVSKSSRERRSALTLALPSERELILARVFDAPRRLVFGALTTPEQVKRWLLGPPGWSMPVCDIDLRVGGAYRYVWRHADGREMGVGGVYREIVPPERIVHTESFDESWYPGEAQITTVLTEESGMTAYTCTIRYESRDARDCVLKSPMEHGVAASYDRLEALLSASAQPTC